MTDAAPDRGKAVGTDRVPWRHRVEYGVIRAAAAGIGALPLDVASGFAGGLARLIAPLLPAMRRAHENMALFSPGLSLSDARRARAAMYDNFARTGVEYLFLDTIANDPSRTLVEGAEHVPAEGPVLFVTAHFGNWEAARIVLARMGRPVALLYRAFNNTLFDAMGRRKMGAVPGLLLHKGRRGSLTLVRHIAGGGAGLILVDQRMTGAPVVPFLGRPALTSTAPAEIALRCKATIIPLRAARIGRSSRFRVTFEPPIPTSDAATMTRAINDRLSAWITAEPGQWFWLHNRWKNAGGAPPAP